MSVSAFRVEVESPGVSWDETLRQRFVAFKDRYGWSFSQISRDMQRFFGKQKESGRARNTGLGQSTLYNYANCKWASSQESLQRFEGRVRTWIDHREHGGKVEEIDTSVQAARLLSHGLAQANRSGKFVVVIGPSGMGKSLLTRHYANAHSTGGVVVVEAYGKMTPRAFLASVCRSLGDIDTGSIDHLMNRVVGLLSEQPRLLAIDEANFLSSTSIDHLVYIYNQVQRGILLLGTEELEQVVRNTRHQRVRSRTHLTIHLGTLSDEEIRNRLLESFDASDVTPSVIEMARRSSYGSYRDLDDLIDHASDSLERYPSKSLSQVLEKVSTRTMGQPKTRR